MIEKLIIKGLKVATAESCTGGLLASKITEEAGASDCIDMGVVTYSNESKIKLLGVKEKTLQDFGAVSSQTALEMSMGIKNLAAADIGVSITGIAGPGGGTDEKPVGLVYVSICTKDIHEFKELRLIGDRTSIRNQTVKVAIDMITAYADNCID